MTSYITVREAHSHSHLQPAYYHYKHVCVRIRLARRRNAQGLLCVFHHGTSLNRWFSFTLLSAPSVPPSFSPLPSCPAAYCCWLSNWRKLVQTRPFMLYDRQRKAVKLRETSRNLRELNTALVWRSNLLGQLTHRFTGTRGHCATGHRYLLLLSVYRTRLYGRGGEISAQCTQSVYKLRRGIETGLSVWTGSTQSLQCQFNWSHLIRFAVDYMYRKRKTNPDRS